MRTRSSAILVALAVLISSSAARQAGAAETQKQPAKTAVAQPAATPADSAAAPQMTMKEAKQKLGIIVFPAKGQAPAQQEADELACLQWAADETGIGPGAPGTDPKAAGQKAAAQTNSATKGAAVAGAAKGAAVGSIFGSISGNAGRGAAYGAAGGALAGRKARKRAASQADAAAQMKAQADQQAKLDSIKKAMSLCLEARGYTIK